MKQALYQATPVRKILNELKKILLKGTIYLHQHIARVTCYGFRGDKRDPCRRASRQEAASSRELPAQMKGWLNTRIGKTRHRQCAKDKEAYESVQTGKDWRLDILTLAVYTADADFRGFISNSISTAIAKHFANAYAPNDNLFAPTYCYAVRCYNGAFHLPTEADT